MEIGDVRLVENFPSMSGGWSDAAEESLKEWARRAQQLKAMHIIEATRSTQFHRRLSLPFLVAGSLASIGTGGGLFESMMWLRVFSFAMTLVATVLGSVTSFLDFGRLSEKHHQSANGYSSFSRDIITCLLFDRNQRRPMRDIIKELRSKYEEITDRAPLITPHVREQFREDHEERRDRKDREDREDRKGRDDRRRVPVSTPLPRMTIQAFPVQPPRNRERRMSEADAQTKDPEVRPFERVSRSVQLGGVAEGARVTISVDGDSGPASVPAEGGASRVPSPP